MKKIQSHSSKEVSMISPIAIDLGSKYTGIFLAQYQAGEALEGKMAIGHVVMHSDNIQYSQAKRTTKRHQIRGAKRRKLAKRLLWVIFENHYQLSQASFSTLEIEAINSLLNRRGFTYLTENVDEASLLETSSTPFNQYFSDKIVAFGNMLEVYQEITSSLGGAKEFYDSSDFALTKKEFIKKLRGDDKENKDSLGKAFDAFKTAVDSFIKAEQDGHKIRGKYLENIKADILKHQDYQFLRAFFGEKITNIINVIGHISNLQLRVLRRYFNNEKMKAGDLWYEKELHKVFFRNLSAAHCKKDLDKENQTALFSLYHSPIMEVFENLPAVKSIPPFEDQNNRRPPKCQSLLISGKTMQTRLKRWTAIVPKLRDEIEKTGIDISSGLALSDIKNIDDWAQALQRILELSKLHDPFFLRAWVGKVGEVGEFSKRGRSELKRILSSQFDPFVAFAKDFYHETSKSRRALWFAEDGKLLDFCNTKPPHKANQFTELLSGVFNSEIDDDKQEKFENLWKENPRIGRRGIKGWCEVAANSQKSYGNSLKEKIKQSLWLKDNEKRLDKEHKTLLEEYKTLLELSDNISEVAELIATTLDIPSKRFSNVFDLAKIYNLMTENPKGFSKNCRRCTKENQWRSTIHKNTNHKGEEDEGALALRLPADTTRPFDGMLARLIDKQAYKIALAKVEQLPSEKLNQKISIPILIEENRFNFTADLHSIKKNAEKSKDSKKKGEEQEKRWLDKTNRIKAASKEICPYTGVSLSANGEIDHIISRSETQKENKGIFNHEANLIYCSTTGNQKKGNQTYYLNDLHDKYLDAQFGHHDRTLIKDWIIQQCKPFLGKDIIAYHEMEPEAQKALRHGLFIDFLRTKLIPFLYQSNKTRVNGTQAYLAKLIMQKIRKFYPLNDISFDVAYIDPMLASQKRTLLAGSYPEYAKQKVQSISSHMIDAAMVMAAALEQPHTRDMLQTAGLGGSNWLADLIPASAKIERIEPKTKYEKNSIQSTQLFKDGLYAEHFIPLILTKDNLGIGFSTKNVSWLKNKEAHQIWWETLSPYLNHAKASLEDMQDEVGSSFKVCSVDKNLAFELFAKVAKEPCSDENLLAADLLESLHYTTQKTNIRSAIYDVKKKKYASIYDPKKKKDAKKKDLLNPQDFTIKLEVKSIYLSAELREISEKTLTYPAITHWEKLVKEDFIQTNQGKKISFDEDGFNTLIKKHFPQKNPNNRSHKSVRKEYSLPKLNSPSGGFRAKRKNADGSKIWQLFTVEGLAAAGFSNKDGKIDFTEQGVMPIPQLEQSGNLTELKTRYQASKGELEPFNAWREVNLTEKYINKLESIRLSTNSKSRFRISITISYKQFKKFIKPLLKNGENIKHWSNLQAELKLENVKDWGETFGELLGTPRSNLFVTATGQKISLEYIVQSSNKVMKDAYQVGTPIE